MGALRSYALMPKRMLIDSTHPEETRVVVVQNGNRLEEFDFETSTKRQIKGNIYLAKVTRVEPSLQAAFVDYGGNRHGFLAFSEIHPDYYQIPVADRQALLAEEARQQSEADAEADHRGGRRGRRHRHRGHRQREDVQRSEPVADEHLVQDAGAIPADETAISEPSAAEAVEAAAAMTEHAPAEVVAGEAPSETAEHHDAEDGAEHDASAADHQPDAEGHEHGFGEAASDAQPAETDAAAAPDAGNGEDHHEDEAVESVGGADALEEVQERLPRFRRQYKIQEVIKRRQVMLVQVVKEERGNKGAALTTYLSLAGRYAVLMPNTARGGGISRKITSAQDRSRLKEVVQDLDVPEGMGIILRTAGASRTKPEIKRDFEYLIRMWETVRDMTLNSQAPTLVYEEGSLIKRSLRDLYNKEIDEIQVAGEAGYHEARDFMKMLMPSNVRAVKQYRDGQPLFSRMGVESQLDAMFSPTVQLRSGGYVVINQTEALVSIDVNSGRSTREHHIEDTALKTNLEAAEEVARQLRLRDLAGLIVIDFIDMDEKRNNRSVERRLSECLKHDRARIQVGRISHFGLLEMSRQRIRTSVLESSTEKCPYCGGSGHVRSVSSLALQLLRALEEMLIKGATHNLVGRTRSEIALYVLNHKRAHLHDLEHRFQIAITIASDDAISGQLPFVIEKGEQVRTLEQARALAVQATAIPIAIDDGKEIEAPIEEIEFEEGEEEIVDAEAAESAEPAEAAEGRAEDGEGGGRRRRRRRRRGRRSDAREEGLPMAGALEGEAEIGRAQ